MTQKAIVIGAGIGGLSTAIRLRLHGFEVSVIEKLSTPGGRCNELSLDGFRFDTGPTLLMMVDELKKLFTDAQKDIKDYLSLTKLEPHSCFKYNDGTNLLFSSDLNKIKQSFEDIEPGAGTALSKWINDNQALFQVGMSDFINRNSPKFISALSPDNLSFFLKGQVTAPLYTTLNSYFKSEKIKDAIAFSALYLGMNPYKTPSIYSVLPYAEISGGLYFPQGGMYKIATGLHKLATDIGINFKFDNSVTGLVTRNNYVNSVVVSGTQSVDCDLVVTNADLPFAYQKIIKEPHPSQKKFDYSCGAFITYFGFKSIPEDTHHHQCFFPSSFNEAMKDLFERSVVPEDPVFYTCCPTVTDSSLAPESMHSLSALVPVPSSNTIDWENEKVPLRNKIISRLEKYGFLESNIVAEKIVTPIDMGKQFSLANNAAFGLSHKLSQMGPFRPRNKHHKYKNLYFVGASTHPGNGIPMVLKSACLTAQRVVKDNPLVSTK